MPWKHKTQQQLGALILVDRHDLRPGGRHRRWTFSISEGLRGWTSNFSAERSMREEIQRLVAQMAFERWEPSIQVDPDL